MIDTELHKRDANTPLTGEFDVDRYPQAFAVEPVGPGISEGVLVAGVDDRVYLCYQERDLTAADPQEHFCYPVMLESTDAGRSWGEPRACCDESGNRIHGSHVSIFRLPTGRLALVCSDLQNFCDGPPGRDGGSKITFRTSGDEGRTWSDPVLVYPLNALCTGGHPVVLTDGTIVLPSYRWISYDSGAESESFNSPSLSYSFSCTSDDGGASWRVSHSQLFVSHYRSACDLEEPTVVELRDGRLLMHLRSQLGRSFESYSTDRGLNWSRPSPLPMAASYTPSLLRRMPTGEILVVWNQVSRGEILKGLHRHRLSCAISRDEGATWENFKNLESLDFRTVIDPPPLDRREVIEQWEDYGYYQPGDTEQYPRAPGGLRICYPNVLFHGDEALVVYDYGNGNVDGIKFRAIPTEWFLD